MEDEGGQWWEGSSKSSFADAAKIAVKHAEDELQGDSPPEYEVVLRVTATPGSSLSEYKVLVKPI